VDRLVPGVVLAFAGGIAAAWNLPPAGTLALLLGFAGLAFVAARLPRLRARLPPPWNARVPPSLLALSLALGVARAGVDSLPPGPADLGRLLPPVPVPVVLRGVARSAPEPLERPAAGDAGRGTPCLFDLDVESLDTDSGSFAARGSVEVFVEGDPPAFLPGDRLRVAGLARPAAGPRNPGARDRAASARRHGVAGVLDAPGPSAVQVLGRGSLLDPARAAASLRGALLAALHRAFRGEGLALYEALLAGKKDALDPAVVRDFRRTGTWHVLVVSGLHIALAAGAVALLLRRTGAGTRTVALGTIAGATAYAAASGFGVPSLRSLVAVAALAAGPLLRRRADPLHSLFLAAGLILAAWPGALEEAGFQLSFGAVLGLLRLAPAVAQVFFARRKFLRRFPVPGADRSPRHLVGDLVERGLPPALSAWAVTAPMLAAHFCQSSPVTPLANLLVVPLTTGALVLGALLLPLGALLPGATAGVADLVARGLALLVAGLARIPGAWMTIPPPPGWLLAADAAVLAAALWRPTRGRLFAAAAGIAAVAVVPLLDPPAPPVPSVLVLDVGHGLSVLLDGGSARVLYDAGGRGPRVADGAILPALRSRGATCLDALVVSHEDWDHFSAARAVLEEARVGALVVGEGFGASEGARAVLEAAGKAGIPVLRAAAGDRLRWPGLDLEVLHPPRGSSPSPPGNDDSLALRARMDGLSALLTGDLETAGVEALLLSGADVRADLLVVPHHGSPGVGDLAVLASASRASAAVASAGPSTRRVRRVASPFAPRFLCTADESAVLVTPEGARPALAPPEE
jgi:competence protein ComEC